MDVGELEPIRLFDSLLLDLPKTLSYVTAG